MNLSTSLKNFKKIHRKKYNQSIYYSESCKDYNFIENLYKFILVQKNSFIFESVEKGKIRGRYTIIGFNPDKIYNINKNKVVIDSFNNKKIIKTNTLQYLNNLIKDFKVKSSNKLPRMSSMLVGYFSYDIIRLIERIPDKCEKDISIPDIRLMRPKNLIIHDPTRIPALELGLFPTKEQRELRNWVMEGIGLKKKKKSKGKKKKGKKKTKGKKSRIKKTKQRR